MNADMSRLMTGRNSPFALSMSPEQSRMGSTARVATSRDMKIGKVFMEANFLLMRNAADVPA